MINPAKYNIKAYQGATYDVTITWSIDGTPVDLTSYTAAMQVRQRPDSASPVLNLSTDSEITLGGTAGTININVPADTMGSAVAGGYLYDLELDSGSEVTRLLQGQFLIEAGVTR